VAAFTATCIFAQGSSEPLYVTRMRTRQEVALPEAMVPPARRRRREALQTALRHSSKDGFAPRVPGLGAGGRES
jgi:hypothetical protein